MCFLEHGRAPDEKVRRTQRLLEPVQKRLGGGCHLTRRRPVLLAGSGLVVADLDQFYAKGAPRPRGAQHRDRNRLNSYTCSRRGDDHRLNSAATGLPPTGRGCRRRLIQPATIPWLGLNR